MQITSPEIEAYLLGLGREQDDLLERMEEKARAEEFPIVDRLVGRLLELLARLKNPRLVVELGSGFGYSAYWFLKGMQGGRLVLTERDSGNLDYARGILTEAGLSERAEFRHGDALQNALTYSDIDILFIDIDKHAYLDAVKSLIPHLSPDALVVADNTLWYGRVTELANADRDTMGILKFNEYMFAARGFHTCLLPLRDGILLAHKNAHDR